jgi:hypothetical protein
MAYERTKYSLAEILDQLEGHRQFHENVLKSKIIPGTTDTPLDPVNRWGHWKAEEAYRHVLSLFDEDWDGELEPEDADWEPIHRKSVWNNK